MKYRVACIQMKVELGEKDQNIQKMIQSIEDVLSEHSDTKLIVFPECAIGGYECPDLLHKVAERFPEGESVDVFTRVAQQYEVHIVYGFTEKDHDPTDGALYNSALLIDDTGTILGRYRKTHLVKGMEEESYQKGHEFPVFDTKLGRIGIMICWDTVFPEVARSLTLNGAEIIVVPEAVEKGIEHQWNLALSSRALDNGVYIIACNHAGTDRELKYYGGSAVIDPMGRIITQVDDSDTFLTGIVDYDQISKARDYFYMLEQRRPEIYKALTRDYSP